ncbi:MAG: L,D-transpeptidase family protein [Pseudolabrys sp.]|nr:L,D-transpeptidase family protein [Pseudolabrys sp.]MDP2295493.1 L,D-transpeptidase family protein [Pseudolabrys sp.]
MTARPSGEYRVLSRPYLRALLASAAVAAAITLAGCNANDVTNGRAHAPLSEKTLAEIASKNMDKESPILARIFKEEAEMEIWKQNRDGQYALLKTYPICRWSGDLGPKKKEGDRQAPEGFYTITPGQMNPASNYYLAFNTGFPNTYDRSWGYTGSELMVHGDCSSRGCYAMTDEQIQEIYALARESFFGGQKAFQLQAMPFRMTALNMAKHRNNPNFAFWKMLKEGYDHFEASRQEPKVAVCERRYVFDPAQPENGSKPLKFDAKGKCPVFELDKTVADVVLDHKRKEQYQMASYISQGVATVPMRHGIDGGMNAVFTEKIAVQEGFDSKGRPIQVALAPGALPRTPDAPAPAQIVSVPKPAPTAADEPVLASLATPRAGLFGVLGISKAQAQPVQAQPAQAQPVTVAAAPSRQPFVLRGSSASLPKPKPAVAHATPALAAQEKPPHQVAQSAQPNPAQPKTAASQPARQRTASAARPEVTDDASRDEPPQLRTAFTAPPPASNSGVLAGAQPVVPTGTFESRWSGFR